MPHDPLTTSGYDAVTQFCTDRGWKYGHEVDPNDKLLCFDPNRWHQIGPIGMCWSPQLAPMRTILYAGDMCVFTNRRTNLFVAPGHTMWALSIEDGSMFKDIVTANWEFIPAHVMVHNRHVVLAGRRSGRSNLQRRVPDTLTVNPVELSIYKNPYQDLLDCHVSGPPPDIRRELYAPTVATRLVVTRRRGKMLIAGDSSVLKAVPQATADIGRADGIG